MEKRAFTVYKTMFKGKELVPLGEQLDYSQDAMTENERNEVKRKQQVTAASSDLNLVEKDKNEVTINKGERLTPE